MSIEKILSRRDRKKKKTQESLEATAWRLFQRKGYDQTTIEDITEAVDVSTRTFFRYFDSKEAVLFGDWRSNLPIVSELILARPPQEPPVVALYEASKELVELYMAERSKVLMRKKLAATSKYIGDYERNVVFAALEETVTQALAKRLDADPQTDLRPSLYATVAVGAFYAAKQVWVANDGQTSLQDLLKEAFEIMKSQASLLENQQS
jgi:AcrR family transcriptional regulator